jgi:hypothetical protein
MCVFSQFVMSDNSYFEVHYQAGHGTHLDTHETTLPELIWLVNSVRVLADCMSVYDMLQQCRF